MHTQNTASPRNLRETVAYLKDRVPAMEWELEEFGNSQVVRGGLPQSSLPENSFNDPYWIVELTDGPIGSRFSYGGLHSGRFQTLQEAIAALIVIFRCQQVISND